MNHKDKCLKNLGDACPYCGSFLIEHKEPRGGTHDQELLEKSTCSNCHRSWDNVLEFKGINYSQDTAPESNPEWERQACAFCGNHITEAEQMFTGSSCTCEDCLREWENKECM